MNILALGKIPLGFPVDPLKERSETIWQEDLQLEICQNCFLIRTVHAVPDEKLEQENQYRSEISALVSMHDEAFLSTIQQKIPLNDDDLILEIGCGDGSLMKHFIGKNFSNIIGIEPAPHPEMGYPFRLIRSFFNAAVAESLLEKRQFPKIIIANYVLELIPDIKNLLKNIFRIMKSDSWFIFEVPYFTDFYLAKRIDGIAHLRCYWFTVKSLRYALRKTGFDIVEIEHDLLYRGGTLRVIAKKEGTQTEHSSVLTDLLEREEYSLTLNGLKQFQDQVDNIRSEIRSKIHHLLNLGYTPCAYGAGLKASTLVNWLGLTANEIRFAVDKDTNKHHRIMPVTQIPIKPVDTLLKECKKNLVVVLNLAIDHKIEVEEFLLKHLSAGSMIVDLLPSITILTVNS